MKYFKWYSIIFLIIFSCTKEKVDNGNHKPVADFTFRDETDHFSLKDISSDIDGDSLYPSWILMCDTIKISWLHSSTPSFRLPLLKDTARLKIKLTISDGDMSDWIIKSIPLPRTTQERIYGLGINLDKGHSNDVSYNWYYDQSDTGPYSLVNCGPTSVTMVIKWENESFSKTPQDARNTYRSEGGWWYTNDIINYLGQYSINNYTISIDDIDIIQNQINSGNIVILCLDMSYVRKQTIDTRHVDKFYNAENTGWGHFIVVKGYKVVDNEVYYETYDPYSLGKRYDDSSLKGENRYYRSEDLNEAVINWWKYAIIVSKSKSKAATMGVDVSKIIHKPGR